MKKAMKNRVDIALLLCVSLMLFIALPAAAESEIVPIEPIIDDQADTLTDLENNRDSVVSEIIENISGTAEDRGYDPSWEGEMTEALQNAEADKLLDALDAGSFDQVVKALFGEDQLAIGSWNEDLVFKPVDPCRIVDTRVSGGPITGGTSRAFFSHGNTTSQGGTICNDPNFDPSAALINITAVDPSSTGHLRVYPVGSSLPNAAILNYKAGTNLANSTIAKTARAAGFDFRIYTNRTTHVVVDLMGYFAPPVKTAVGTTVVSTTTSLPPGNKSFETPSCPAGYRITGGGCHFSHYDSTLRMIGSRPWNAERWHCDVMNVGAFTRSAIAHGICTQIPGR